MAAQITIFLFFLGLFIVIMPFVAIWKIWHILERVEKSINEANEILLKLVK